MSHYLLDIRWEEKDDKVDVLLKPGSSQGMTALEAGLEAEVFQIVPDEEENSLVLKIWNRDSRPDIRRQYKLLELLHSYSMPVSRPLGWGYDLNGNQVLLTPYDGAPVTRLGAAVVRKLAKMLIDIHKLPVDTEFSDLLPKYDFMSYFYPSIDQHEDIKRLLMPLLERANLNHHSVIHGDFNLGNVLEQEGQYKIIDWTNGQLGDARYDIAWSVIVMRIFAGDRNAAVYRAACLSATAYTDEELELFEAIATLRGLLLSRGSDLLKGKDMMKRVRNIFNENKYLTADVIL
ncbi:phosphotransferase family protein [Paenibacillus sp. PDC88]|uniref:phosphotransferase family protein n=1 Tax=Paenibacillus sp. PDC88 TaxID=1884375 RepID=UPI00089A5543|nr:aminoglycoside phosphotransferase family protein [Paenibacillus sp. PDC88]SDW36248.1 Predicted kinase, aminoglycoside phosphotransferase (APT) family [Paenibacillus sp. PDC88]